MYNGVRRDLWLSYNNLVGTIPASLGVLSFVECVS